jgi:hypothetical protein
VQKASPTYKPIGATSVAPLAKRGRQGLNNTIPRNINKSWKQHEVTAQGKPQGANKKHKENQHKGSTRAKQEAQGKHKRGTQGNNNNKSNKKKET